MPPHATTSVLPVLRHIGYLPLVMRDSASRMLREVHQYSLGMRWHLLAVHDDFTADIDVLPNLPLKSRADVGLVQNADSRFQSLVGFQRLWRVVEPDQHVDVGVAGSLKLQNPVIVKHAVPFHVLKPAL